MFLDSPPSSSDDDLPFEDYPVDQRSCRLLGPTALIVQALLGVLVILSLVYKRHRETPKRPWRIWLYDVSKQLAGQMFVHGVNLLISGVVASVSSGNACVFYFLNILIDTTLGVGLIYFLLKFFNFLLTEKYEFEGFVSGQYGSPPSATYWLRQTAVYVLCLTLMKLVVVALFALFPGVFVIGQWLLSWLGDGDLAQVIFVMGVFPIIMNIMQFWLIDSIVKANEQSAPLALPDTALPQDREPLFRASESDNEDDDDDSPINRKYDIENPKSRSHSRDIGPTPPADLRALTPDPKSTSTSASGSATPMDVQNQDLAMRRYRSPSPPARPAPPVGGGEDEWAWDDPAEQPWEDEAKSGSDSHVAP